MKNRLFQKFENLMTAITFAEKGEHDYAIRLTDSSYKRKQRKSSKQARIAPPENRPQMRL